MANAERVSDRPASATSTRASTAAAVSPPAARAARTLLAVHQLRAQTVAHKHEQLALLPRAAPAQHAPRDVSLAAGLHGLEKVQ